MTAVLTIKAEALGAITVLENINTLIEKSVRSTGILASVTATLRGHWKGVAEDVTAVNRQLGLARQETERVAGAARFMHAGFLSTVGVVQNLKSGMKGVRDDAILAARAANAIRAPRFSGGGTSSGPGAAAFSFTPKPPRAPAAAEKPSQHENASLFAGGFISAPASPAASVIPPLGAVGGDALKGASGAFASGFSALSGGIGRALSTAVGGAAKIFGSGLAGAAAGVGGLLTGAVVGAMGLGVDVLKTGVGIAVDIAESGFKAAMGVATTALKIGVVAAAGLLANSARLAIADEPLREAFGNITASKGLGEQVQVLKELKEAAHGTISEIELMKGANYALSLGAAENTDQLGFLIEAGRRLGKAMGRDAKEGFNDLALGIGRQSRLILDNLGLIIDEEAAYKKYAAAVGASVDALSEEEKRLVFQETAYESIRQKLRALGDEKDAVTDKTGRLKAAFSDVSAKIGTAFLPVLGQLFDNWSRFLGSLDPEKISSGVGAAFDAAKGAAGATLDFVLGKESEVNARLKSFGGSLFSALTDPSAEAFKIVGLRAEQLLIAFKGGFEKLWIDVQTLGVQAIQNVLDEGIGALTFLSPLAKILGLDDVISKRFLVDQSARDEVGGLGAFNKGTVDKVTGIKNDVIEKRIADLERERLKNRSSQSGPDQDNEIVDGRQTGKLAGLKRTAVAGGLFAAITSGISPELLAKNAPHIERRASAEAAEKREKAEVEALKKSINAEIDAREKLRDSFKDEIEQRKKVEETLREAADNGRAALRGEEDPNKRIAERLKEASEKLRDFPKSMADLNEKIRENTKAMSEAVSENKKEMAAAFAAFNDGLRKQAASFLQEDPQDGETVRVRALKRRSKRELGRLNTGLINDVFRAPSFDGIGGDLGGFGAQNIERAGGVIDQRFPGLEQALGRTRGTDGTTQLAQFQAQIVILEQQQNERIQGILDAATKLNEEQTKLGAERIALQAQIQAALEKISGITALEIRSIADGHARVARVEADIERFKKELEKVLSRLAKK